MSEINSNFVTDDSSDSVENKRPVVVNATQLSISVPKAKQGSNQLIVDSASFEIRAGEILAIIGPNGAGKSTLLNCIAGGTEYTGELRFDGFATVPKLRARQIATLPQNSLLNFPYRVEEVVMLSRIPHKSGHTVDQKIISEALELMDIAYLAKRLYTDLSGGEKQRVQLARILAQIWRTEDIPAQPESQPESQRLLLLDEPTAALDLGHQADLMRAVKAFSQSGVAVVMVVHDINLAARYADRVLALQCSQVMAFGSVETVITKANMEALFSTKVEVVAEPISGTPYVMHLS
jgi:iron complex transport system ATP-binding protein